MADPAGVSRSLILLLCLGAALAGVGASPPSATGETEAPPPIPVAPGHVGGRVYAEALPGRQLEQALVGTLVTVMPYSRAFLDRLCAIREAARASARGYAGSATELRTEQARYEARLRASGHADLIRVVVAGADGRFTVGGVPSGPAILVARHAVFVERGGPRQSRKERELFGAHPRLIGYYAVDVWVRELLVPAAGSIVVDLSDRNVWFTVIEEERRLDPSR